MDMTSLIIGAALGAAAGYFGGKAMGSNGDAIKRLQSDLNNALNENEKFRKKSKDLTRDLEDAQSQLSKLRRQASSLDSSKDDLEDELHDKDMEIGRRRQRNEEMTIQIKELKEAVDAFNSEIEVLKK